MTTSDDSRANASAVDALVARAVRQRGIGRYTRHLLLCTGPDCAPAETALESWEYLKRRLRGELHRGEWYDIGTPERLAALDRQLCTRTAEV